MNREDRQKADYLLGYIEAKQDAQDIERRMETLRQQMEAAKRAAEDWIGGSSGRRGDLSDYFARGEDIMREWSESMSVSLAVMKEIETAIDRLEDQKQRRVLKLHYIDGIPWTKIPDIMHYGIDNVYRLRRMALRNMQINNSTQELKE